MALIDLSHKPRGLLKAALKAPTYLYRAHLGVLFGHRFLMVEHRGRRSGARYRTVIEVAGRIPERSEWVCTSGTGPKADWYLNLRAGGLEAVWIGSRRRSATVRFLEPDESARIMGDYERAHPTTAAKLYRVMGVSYDGTDADRVRMMADIPMVAFAVEG
jgi:deazaflavin-dependent oxidoreductase (nitroreductase family)